MPSGFNAVEEVYELQTFCYCRYWNNTYNCSHSEYRRQNEIITSAKYVQSENNKEQVGSPKIHPRLCAMCWEDNVMAVCKLHRRVKMFNGGRMGTHNNAGECHTVKQCQFWSSQHCAHSIGQKTFLPTCTHCELPWHCLSYTRHLIFNEFDKHLLVLYSKTWSYPVFHTGRVYHYFPTY